MADRRTAAAAVIGGGFSGLLTAAHLLSGDPDVQVRLVERSDRFARGRAYAPAAADPLLNVRAANMSAFPDRPRDFVDWLAAQGEASGPDAFVSRRRYGDYLQGLLRDEIAAPGRAGRLLLEADEAVRLSRAAGRWRVELALGRKFEADVVVLAVGLAPPAPAPGTEPSALAAAAYVDDPWSMDPTALPDGHLLLLGSGLTMVDVALSLAGPGRRLLAVSPHGLIPRSHGPTVLAPLPDRALDTPKLALAALRARARATGWREAVDGVRPLTEAVWGRWSLAERRRFLRHLRPWWDVHRHRMAPAVAAEVAGHIASGGLTVAAGRVERLAWDGEQFEAVIRGRGQAKPQVWRFAGVVNCTGPRGDLEAASPLLAGLVADGMIRPDPMRLGAEVSPEDFQALGADGRATAGLFLVGPLTRFAVWEASAVPDLRNQTAQVARAALASLDRAPAAGRATDAPLGIR
jgi:uncharacterized NAD(P)/FAD-binding protein YdhS